MPLDRDELYRVAKAHTKLEKDAVEKIVSRFWTQTMSGYVNGRAFEELKAADDLAEIARANGSKGGRPKKPSGLSEENPGGSKSETQVVPNQKAIQTPDSITPVREGEGLDGPSPKPEPKPKRSRRAPADFIPDAALALTELPDLDVEAETAKLRDWEFKTARSDWPAVWRNWIRTAKETGKYARKPTDQIRWQ